MEQKSFHPYINGVCQALVQYQGNPTDGALVLLQRQIDALSGVTHKISDLQKFLDPQQELANAECLTGLIGLISHGRANPLLAQKVMTFLSNLANDSGLKKTLTENYNLLSSLEFYRQTLSNFSDPNLLQCLKLMAKVSSGCKIPYLGSYVETLIPFLLKTLETKGGELFEPSLNTLSNMCRNNFAVQNYIKNLPNVKVLCKVLVGNLTHTSSHVKIWTMSILFHAFLHQDVGAKVFGSKNAIQTFMIMFHVLFNNRHAVPSVVDLFMDILKERHMQKALFNNADLTTCLHQVGSLLCKLHNQSSACEKVLELLLFFFAIPELKPLLCHLFLDFSSLQETVTYENILTSHKPDHPCVGLIYHAGQAITAGFDTPLKAFTLLAKVTKESYSGACNGLTPRVDLILACSLAVLQHNIPQHPSAKTASYQRQVHSLNVLINLQQQEAVSQVVSHTLLDSNIYTDLISHQLNNNLQAVQPSTCDQLDECSEAGLDVVVFTLELAKCLSRFSVSTQRLLHKYLQESGITHVLSHALTSPKRERVQAALSILTLGCTMPEFPVHLLSVNVAAINCKRLQVPLSHNSKPAEKWTENKENMPRLQMSSASATKTTTPSVLSSGQTAELDQSVQILIDKINTTMEVKDVKTSEIVSVYHHRLQSLQSKENSLQDLLEAKSIALQQADRLLAEFRHRKVEYEAEVTKLRELLRDGEKSKEETVESLVFAKSDFEKLQADHEAILAQKTNLEVISDEHTVLVEAYAEQGAKLEGIQKTLAALKHEHEQLLEEHQIQERHFKQLSEVLHNQAKERDAKISDSAKKLQKSEAELKKQREDQKELEQCLDDLKAELERMDHKKKELQSQLTTLELICKQNEQSLKTKEQQLEQKDEIITKHVQKIQKLNQIQAMLNQLNTD